MHYTGTEQNFLINRLLVLYDQLIFSTFKIFFYNDYNSNIKFLFYTGWKTQQASTLRTAKFLGPSIANMRLFAIFANGFDCSVQLLSRINILPCEVYTSQEMPWQQRWTKITFWSVSKHSKSDAETE